MKKILSAFILQLLYWLVLFNLVRIAFILYYSGLIRIEGIAWTEVLKVFVFSFRLDLATASYLMVIPFLVMLLQSFLSPAWLNRITQVYTLLVTCVYILSGIGEMGIYGEWKTKLNFKVIKYLSRPDEIYNSADTSTFFLLIFLFLLLCAVAAFIYHRLFFRKLVHVKRNVAASLAFALLTPPLLFVALRGGIQQIPINQSQSYYSRYNIMNTVAVNNFFNFYISIFENLANFGRNPYLFMQEEKAAEIIKSLYAVPSDSVTRILQVSRPNIVMLILESWSADLIESLGGEPGITPEFRQLERDGILFDQIYASGSRSEQGMASIFSGFPAHPVSSITVQPDKYSRLPSLVSMLKPLGYSSGFYFGGQLIYGNIKSYIFFNGFDRIKEIYDFPNDLPQGKLGIHDQFTLGFLNSDLDQYDQPFFAVLFTLSTHSPWDQPFEKPLLWGDNEREYINAAYYTDHCLGEFFKEVGKKAWYDSTLFIIVADHSHNSYRNWHPQSREYHRIPLLFLGPAIKPEFRGKLWSKMGNQHDIAATLLSQLGVGYKPFRWSKDLFNPTVQDFAYYSTEDGLGWIRPYAYFAWDAGPDFTYFSYFVNEGLKDSVLTEGKAYLQEVFREYIEN